jgi:hypothetical protein
MENQTILRLLKVGDKVKLSRTCRSLYGDPEILTIKEIKGDKILTSMYSIWFEPHELVLNQSNNGKPDYSQSS